MYPAWLTVMAISVSAIRSSSLISSTLSTICVRRASPKSFCISRSSVMITALSFFSLARIERNSAISAWISFNSLDRKSTRLNSSHCNLVCRLLLEKKIRSEEHTSELQSPCNIVCRLLLENLGVVLGGTLAVVTAAQLTAGGEDRIVTFFFFNTRLHSNDPALPGRFVLEG